jgi:hypothetical protein
MTTPYTDPQTVHNPTTGGSPPASWGDTVRDNQQLFSTPPSVKAVRTAAQSIANNTTTTVQFNGADEWDTDSFHSTTSNNTRLTIPAGLGGIYHLIASLSWGASAAASTRSIGLRLNGSVLIVGQQFDNQLTNGANISASALAKLSAGDYVEVTCFQFSGAAINITATFSAHWVSL